MSSWATIAKASPQPVVAAQDLSSSTENLRLLVVDANAIIGGIKLEGIADRAVTIQEVFDEIRDKQSRQFLTTLPYKLQLSEPTEESIKAGKRVREQGSWSHTDLAACMARYCYSSAAICSASWPGCCRLLLETQLYTAFIANLFLHTFAWLLQFLILSISSCSNPLLFISLLAVVLFSSPCSLCVLLQ
jgi:hypothetical protein